MDLRALLQGFGQMTHSGQMHWQSDRPSTTNPVWPIYATPSPGKAEAERGHHAALQRIGTALGLMPGTDLHRACVPAIQVLLKDRARLDSGVIMTSERDEFGEEYTCERRGLGLRAMIDAAMQAQERDKQ
jgi:hypothetical protein